MVEVLAERDDVETNSRDNNGKTPPLRAAGRGRERVVRFLRLNGFQDIVKYPPAVVGYPIAS